MRPRRRVWFTASGRGNIGEVGGSAGWERWCKGKCECVNLRELQVRDGLGGMCICIIHKHVYVCTCRACMYVCTAGLTRETTLPKMDSIEVQNPRHVISLYYHLFRVVLNVVALQLHKLVEPELRQRLALSGVLPAHPRKILACVSMYGQGRVSYLPAQGSRSGSQRQCRLRRRQRAHGPWRCPWSRCWPSDRTGCRS